MLQLWELSSETKTSKSEFKHNGYPQNIVNHFLKKFLKKLFIEKDLNFMVPKIDLTLVLPYLGKLSLDLRARLIRTIERDLPYYKLKVAFRSNCRLNTLFWCKDSLEKKIRSGITYRYMCSNCKVTWSSPILQENALKSLNSMQYLTIYGSVIAS